jgi:hypothetical protein
MSFDDLFRRDRPNQMLQITPSHLVAAFARRRGAEQRPPVLSGNVCHRISQAQVQKLCIKGRRMTKVKNQSSERLSDYVKLLKALCSCCDRGDEIVALSLATAIRVLIHDTQNSTSLLTHLDLKRGWFLSSNLNDPRERVHLGLVRRINVGVNDGKGGEARYWPICDETYFPSPTQHFRQLEFDNWWKEVVFRE